ncbi:MAG: ATP-binding protein [Chitinophagaceae bacterium]|nr:ATP-binding protein [Oligoflexus sp.]
MESQRFLAFWGLKTLPGNGQIDLDQLYWQEHTQSLVSRLLLALQKTGNISVIVAPAGHGKSTLARWLYHRIDSETHDAAIISLMKQEHNAGWLLPRLAHYLGLPDSVRDSRAILQNLSSVHGKILTIIIDNAHYLSDAEAFDEIASLCQIQALADCRINFVLLGNPKLGQSIENNRDLQHRLGLLSELQPFSRLDLQTYLSQRMQDIGISRRILVPESLALIAQQGSMTFAGINALLEACLFEAFLKEQKTISTEIVYAAFENTGLRPQNVNRPQDRDSEPIKATKVQQKKRTSSAAPKAVNSSGDLNSLFYKSSQDPEGED